MENPYPKDVFKWNNKEKLNFDRGRFNQHCFEVFENCREDVLELINYQLNNSVLLGVERRILGKLKECVEESTGVTK